jgi:chemotaxis family two-component system sensor kinase Cph1
LLRWTDEPIVLANELVSDDHSPQLPDSIQPHGVLLALDESDFTILQVSANTEAHLGIEPQQLLGQALATLCDPEPVRALVAKQLSESNQVVPLMLGVRTSRGALPFNGFVHRTQSTIILEMEPADMETSIRLSSLYHQVRETLSQLQQAPNRETLLQGLVEAIQALTGYGQVLVYQFDPQGAGAVVAEAKHRELPAYLGLHFPAVDIPEWVRASYMQGKLRALPDLQASPVPLLPALHPTTAAPLDLSTALLRSSNPCAVEYYHNMGMSAALVISLIQERALWGLVCCHHPTPKPLTYETRSACELLTQVAASVLAKTDKQDNLDQQQQHYTLQAEFIASITQANTLLEALTQPDARLLSLVNATGAAICLGSELRLLGTTPSKAAVQALINWANSEIDDTLLQTTCLSQIYPPAAAFASIASGLLMLKISQVQRYWILWFRPEVLQTVNWAGQPDQGVEIDEQSQVHLSPRASFDLWQETVKATALPWQPFEIKGAIDLRTAIVGIVLKQAEALGELNDELQRSNQELASFAYAAAHDLKEPLRGIYNYANILQEDYGQVLDEDGMEYLVEIQGFSQRMETLINALLRMAQLRQAELFFEAFDLNGGLKNVEKVVRASWPEADFELRVPQPLPIVQGDPALLSEVLRNLLNNAIKYNTQADKWVEVGYQDYDGDLSGQRSCVFYIRDNGIGIRPEHTPVVFQLFKRLHPQEHYGGGTGVGLAIVNQIIERHHGRIWVESIPGEGSTFYFTLQGVPDEAGQRLLATN